MAAERDPHVTRYERDTVLCGQFALRASIATWREFQTVIDWRREQLQAMQVTIALGRAVGPEDVPSLEAGAIVVATGAKPQVAHLPGRDISTVNVITAHEAVGKGCPNARTAVVWDDAGGVIGAGAIESLVVQELRVHVVIPGFAVAEDLDLIQRVPFYERLLSAGVTFVPNTEVIGLSDDKVRVRNVYSLQESHIESVAVLVAWCGNQVVESLSRALSVSNFSWPVIV